jgi:8-oxo-dGTP pyrophosphatase MutT (NUDIX family)
MPEVVTCILLNDKGEILILKRSDKVKTYKGCWSGIAGYIEVGERPIDTAYKEIREEAGLEKEDVELVKQVDPVEFTDYYDNERYDWIIYPFLFKCRKKGKIQIDWEHSDYKWIRPSSINKFDTVPHFNTVVSKLLM